MISVAILGGTFDPPTVAHLAVAHAALDQLDIDVVWLLPTGDPVGKPAATAATTRLHWCRAAADDARIDVCAIEAGRPGVTYTVDTLRELARIPIRITWLVGDDIDLSVWREPSECQRLASFVRVPRLGYPERRDFPRLRLDAGRAVSSSDVRRRLAAGQPIRGLVPAAAGELLEAAAT